ncbi:helix-turn-helix domain-containing protein [Pseudoalteromonas sp. SMS1]|uniref:helix-turn-helix domain-containing protein n=1 Tax=Pseudoalteromonas sp. SMS1 TaxID=2908894 RepID=UPI001F44132F|nr:helix-turn-helix domain-containing protein [Pseudoalteromonas sp. SMS1]MCF2856035.1 helix-turn-helix domain-containing protein [Pseudoalteromonas sp. SMS1]
MYTAIPPPVSLAPYVINFWYAHGATPDVPQAIHSDGCISILWVTAGESQINDVSIYSGAFLLGPQTTSHLWHFKTNQHTMFGVRLTPLGAKHFTTMPLKYAKNQCIELNELVSTTKLTMKISQPLATPRECINTLSAWLEAHLKRFSYQLPTAYSLVLKQIESKARSKKLSQLYDTMGVNSRCVERAFMDVMGIGAKEYATLMEVSKSRNAIKHNPNKSLTEIAYDLEYTDQSHFIRQFKKVMKITPKQYRMRLPI